MDAYGRVLDTYVPPVAIEPREVPFRFTGSAGEYFRIWIVNTLLTIVTLGIYSAWAKVRNKQYFYRNTLLDGSSFEYLADPILILKGRLIAAAALGLLFASQFYSLPLYVCLVIGLVVVSPWVLVRALSFNARNSAYRNIRFAFTGRAGEATALYLGMVLLHVASCGMAYPYVQWRLTKFVVWRHLFGDLTFSWSSKAGAYYRAYLLAAALTIPGYVVLFVFALPGIKAGPESASEVLTPFLIVFYLYLLVPGAFLRARLANVLYDGLMVGEHYFSSKQQGTALVQIYVVNALAILLSAGLLIPWAKIRLATYRASTLTVHAVGPLHAEKLLDDEANALGEGLSDLGDFDLGIGV